MCLAGLGQGKFFTHRWTRRPVFQTGHKRGVNAGQLFWRRIWQNHSANICIALHRVSGIELYAAAPPDDHHAPALPTPPLAPCTSTVSSGFAGPRWSNPRCAVAYGVPMAAPWAKETFGGRRCTCAALHNARSAYVPLIVPAV